MQYRKRRPHRTLNKNQQKVVRGQEAGRERPPLSASYPAVERLLVELVFSNVQGDIIEERSAEWTPSDPVDFSAPCPGRCGDGKMDLEGKIGETIRRQAPEAEGRGKCLRPIYAGASEVCGIELRARIRVTYKPAE